MKSVIFIRVFLIMGRAYLHSDGSSMMQQKKMGFFISTAQQSNFGLSNTGIHSPQEWPLPIAYTGLRWRKGWAPVENNCHNDSLVKIWSLIVESTFLLGISQARHGLHVFQNQLSFFVLTPHYSIAIYTGPWNDENDSNLFPNHAPTVFLLRSTQRQSHKI